MSIATRTGDHGTTALMYNRRVSKCHPRVEACGSVDELNSILGVARAGAGDSVIRDALLGVQKDLVILMGELATHNDERERYLRDGFQSLTTDHTQKLDKLVSHYEGQALSYRSWATPGGTAAAAALDLARSTCRRAERRVCQLSECGELANSESLVYLNRLSDVLWLMARWLETRVDGSPGAVVV